MAFPGCSFVPLRLSVVGELVSNSSNYSRCRLREAELEEASLHFHIQQLHTSRFLIIRCWWLFFFHAVVHKLGPVPRDSHPTIWKCKLVDLIKSRGQA